MTYQRPVNRRLPNQDQLDRQIHVSYIADPSSSVGCSLGSAVSPPAEDGQTVHLPFAEFNELLTMKLLRQLELLEADTVVEAAS